jgi:hypothetical protein
MSIVGSVVQGSGGGVSDLKDTVEKFSITFADSPYTIATTASCLISADTADGAIVILPPASLTDNQIVQIEDDGLNAATNIITFQATVDGVADPTIESDGGGMTVEYNGTRWRTRDTDDNLLKYHADLNEIQARGDAALVAASIKTSSGLVVIGADGSISAVNGVIGLAGAQTEKTVADSTNIGANVDQNGTSDFGNATFQQDQTSGLDNTDTSDNIGPFDNSASTWTTGQIDTFLGTGGANLYFNRGGTNDAQLVVDLGSSLLVESFTMYSGSSINWNAFTGDCLVIEGSNTSPTAGFTLLYTGGGNYNLIPLSSVVQPLDVTGAYQWIRISSNQINNSWVGSIILNATQYYTASNTSDLAITTGAVTTDPSSLVIYDENNDPITGAGKMNVGYEVDGGGFSTPVDQETFKALGGIASTTDFSLQPQAVGAQRWSRATISTISTVFRASASGTIFEVDSVSVFEVTATGVISSKQFYAETVALTAGASVATNCQLSNKFSLTPDQDFTLANPTNLKAGAEYTWIITNDATPRTITFDTAFLFAGGSAPSLTASAGAIDIFRGECDGIDILITQAILDLS